ncbi:MAG: PhnD/SsuA/transferrin family substrate-binding protein, partial [Ilumatobacteraceae bacterium]
RQDYETETLVTHALRGEGFDVSQIHLRHIWPLPANLGELLRGFKQVIVPEMNTGQLITVLCDEVAVIGSFDVVAPFASGGRYRSVIVSSKPLSVGEWKQRGDCRLVANNPDSLSGWVSLSWAWGERLDDLRFVGAHVESIREIVEGRADLASIDAVTFEHVITSQPSVAARVHVVGHGPEVPSLPLVCANRFADNVPAFRRVLASLTAPESLSQDRELADALGTLKIKGFVPFGIEAFEFLPGLLPPPVG